MFIFQLTPRDPSDPVWREHVGKVIVRASDEWVARRICAIAFGGYGEELDLDNPAPIDAAWSDHRLVS